MPESQATPFSMQEQNQGNLFLFLGYLDAPLLLGHKTRNAPVTFSRIDICEYQE